MDIDYSSVLDWEDSGYYDEIYYRDFQIHAIGFFYNSNKHYPNIDMKWLFELYFSLRQRYEAELGNPRYLNLDSGDLYLELEEEGLIDKNNYPKSDRTIDNYYGDAMMWIIMQWSHFTFKYKLYSKDMIKLISFEYMVHAFTVGHERSFDSQSEILYELFILKEFD